MEMKSKIKTIICITLIMTVVLSGNVFAIGKCKTTFNVENVLKDIEYLSSDDEFPAPNYRMAGTEGEIKAGEFIENKFLKLGLNTEDQNFEYDTYNFEGYLKDITNNKEVDVLSISGDTPGGSIRANLLNVNEGTKEDVDSILDQANGKIILLNYNNQTNVEYLIEKLGSITKGFVVYFGVRSTASSYQESVLNIKYDNGYSNLIDDEGYFECLVNEDVYNEYLSYLENDIEIEFEVYVGYSIELKESKNIIALYDNKYTDQEIIIGAHYDGVNCPAANDNASGTATMLELARVISENKLNYDIRFIAFGSEEPGLHGSSNYVDTLTEDEISNIEYVINLDMVGVGDELGIFKATEESDTELVELADKIAEKNNVNHNVYTMGRSDHVPFDYYGIKSIMLLYQEDLNYHTENDTYENLLESNIENDNIKNVLNLVMRIVNKINCGFQTNSEINEAA